MTIAATSRSRVAYAFEALYGTAPTSPNFSDIRRTNGNLTTKKTTITSDEIEIDRNIRDEYMTGQDVTGSYDFEFSTGSFEDLLASVMQGTWGGPGLNQLLNGTLQRSLTFEEAVDLGGGSLAFFRFTGCEISSMTLTMASRAGVKGTMTVMGQQEVLDTAPVSGATYLLPNTTPIITSVNVASLNIAGLTPQPKIKSLAFTINNNLRIRDQVASLYTNEFGDGSCDVTGTLDAYFENSVLYQQVLAHGGGTIGLVLGNIAGSRYSIQMPNCRFLDGAKRLGGKNDDVMISIPFRALYDYNSGASINITRGVA